MARLDADTKIKLKGLLDAVPLVPYAKIRDALNKADMPLPSGREWTVADVSYHAIRMGIRRKRPKLTEQKRLNRSEGMKRSWARRRGVVAPVAIVANPSNPSPVEVITYVVAAQNIPVSIKQYVIGLVMR